MKNIRFALPVLFSVLAVSAFADDCEVTIDGTDTMRFDKQEIVVDKACEKFTVNLTHSGKLAKNVMGHNWVLTTAADMQAVATEGMQAGLENEYVKAGDTRVIASTTIIGAGEKTSVTFDVKKLSADESYMFFCSFPGHWSIMKGTLSLK